MYKLDLLHSRVEIIIRLNIQDDKEKRKKKKKDKNIPLVENCRKKYTAPTVFVFKE